MTATRFGRLALASAAAVLLAACVTVPVTSSPALDEARALYDRAAGDADAARSAPLELRSAQQALTQAEAALKSGEDMATVEHYAYLARQRSATALQAGEIAKAEQAVAASAGERNRILMQARSREAEQDRAASERARMQAQASSADAEAARQAAERDRMQAQASSAEAEAARKAAEAQLAAAQSAEAKAARLQRQLTELEAKRTERGMVLTLGDVLFDSGQAELKSGAFTTIDRLATFMRENPERTLLVEGYTDSVGSDAYNLSLSQRRADAVRAALLARGIDGSRITTSGMGKANPVAGNDTAAGRQRNRRVEIVISTTG